MLRIGRMSSWLGVPLQYGLNACADINFLCRQPGLPRENFRQSGLADVAWRSRILHLDADATWHDEIDGSRAIEFEQPVNQLVMRAAVSVNGIGINSNRALSRVEGATCGVEGNALFHALIPSFLESSERSARVVMVAGRHLKPAAIDA